MKRPARKSQYLALITLFFLVMLSVGGCGFDLQNALPDARNNGATTIPTLDLPPTFTMTPSLIPTRLTFTPTPTIELPPTRSPTPTLPPTPTVTPTAEGAINIIGCQYSYIPVSLLINGGFEGGQFPQESQDVLVPDGWTAFWVTPGTKVAYDPSNGDGYQRPAMSVISSAPPFDNPSRTHEGSQALRISGNSRVFNAGVYQSVPVSPGYALCFIGFAHAWSRSGGDDPHYSTVSLTDEQRNVSFQLGIDPRGGINPWSPDVIWGTVQGIYDVYQLVPSVETRALADAVTVFIRGSVLWRYPHNELFFDGFLLVQHP